MNSLLTDVCDILNDCFCVMLCTDCFWPVNWTLMVFSCMCVCVSLPSWRPYLFGAGCFSIKTPWWVFPIHSQHASRCILTRERPHSFHSFDILACSYQLCNLAACGVALHMFFFFLLFLSVLHCILFNESWSFTSVAYNIINRFFNITMNK